MVVDMLIRTKVQHVALQQLLYRIECSSIRDTGRYNTPEVSLEKHCILIIIDMSTVYSRFHTQ